MRIYATVGILLASLAPSLQAQKIVTDSPHAAAAAELIEVMEMEKHSMLGFETFQNTLVAANLMSKQVAVVMAEFIKEVLPWDKVGPEYVRIYQATFSEAELRELIAFYRSPVGQKTVAETPNLMRETSQVMNRLLLPHTAELQRRLMSAMGIGG